MGKLVCELYRLVLRHAAAEEHFLILRTLLLHIYAVALNSCNKDNKRSARTGEDGRRGGFAGCGNARSTTRWSEVWTAAVHGQTWKFLELQHLFPH